MSITVNSDSSSFVDKDLSDSIQLISFVADKEYIVSIRADLGSTSESTSGPLNTNSGDTTYIIKAKITHTDLSVSETFVKTVTKESELTQISYNFDRTIYLQENETLTVWAESSDATDTSISGDIYIAAVRAAGGGALLSMERADVLGWLEIEFAPLTLATPDDTIYQIVENAIRYWNTHSAYKISRVYDYDITNSRYRMQLDTDFKNVFEVYPTTSTTWIWNNHPMWTLLGLTILDNVTSDLIIMSEAFKNYKKYVGSNFAWKWERSTDSSTGGYLYVDNVPSGVSSLFVVGSKRIRSTDSIQDDYILDWILNYSKALLKQIEGNTLRKGDLIGLHNDGGDMISEGKTEQEEMKESLAREGRWAALAARF